MSFEKVRQLVCDQLGKSIDKVTADSKIVDDLGADSLDVVEMLMAAYDEFGVEVPDDKIESLKTIGDVVEYIQNEID